MDRDNARDLEAIDEQAEAQAQDDRAEAAQPEHSAVGSAEGTTAADDVDLDANVTADGAHGHIAIYAGDSIDLDASITVSAVGNGTVLVSASTDFNDGSPQNGLDATAVDEGQVLWGFSARIVDPGLTLQYSLPKTGKE